MSGLAPASGPSLSTATLGALYEAWPCTVSAASAACLASASEASLMLPGGCSPSGPVSVPAVGAAITAAGPATSSDGSEMVAGTLPPAPGASPAAGVDWSVTVSVEG